MYVTPSREAIFVTYLSENHVLLLLLLLLLAIAVAAATVTATM